MPKDNEKTERMDEGVHAHQPMDATFLARALADILRLPEECLGISFVYLNRYRKFRRQQENLPDLNKHMLVLACLSLGAKATEAPRRVREFLLPAWRLMHMGKLAAAPLICPSPTYDALRSAFVRTELILLRVLRFELRVPTPFDFISGYMVGVMCDFGVGDSSLDAADEFDARSKEYKEGNRIVDVMDTGIAKDCKTKAMAACKDYQLSNYFPAKTLAAVCVYTTLRDRGLLPRVNVKTWLREKISRTIEMEDFEEAVSGLDRI